MKRSHKACLFEAAAAAFLSAGAILLIATFLPIINPELFNFATDEHGRTRHVAPGNLGKRAQPLSYYFIGTPLSLLLLAGAWRFNMKALRLKGEI
jgi:hypothetical protein